MTDDEIIFAVEAFRFDAGPVTAQSRLHALSCRDWNADRPAASGQRA
jgi:hypothetical protein